MKKTLSLIFLMLMILQVHADLSRATSGNLNHSFTAECGSGDCLIGGEVDEVAEFQMNSHAARMLYDVRRSLTGRTPNRDQASVDCPQKQGYRTCLPSANGGPPKQKCGDYTRNC
ncbi:uncharacterized protein LOC114730824 [Neltuma alba]|uniref:uncharacterized protein LOC114730824 n=1 Tax=Neltuma alba TaxID=207710 RepID=UPI0010A42BAF|nr:uncharacterized protein LOC114730824 [Prosopis alba]